MFEVLFADPAAGAAKGGAQHQAHGIDALVVGCVDVDDVEAVHQPAADTLRVAAAIADSADGDEARIEHGGVACAQDVGGEIEFGGEASQTRSEFVAREEGFAADRERRAAGDFGEAATSANGWSALIAVVDISGDYSDSWSYLLSGVRRPLVEHCFEVGFARGCEGRVVVEHDEPVAGGVGDGGDAEAGALAKVLVEGDVLEGDAEGGVVVDDGAFEGRVIEDDEFGGGVGACDPRAQIAHPAQKRVRAIARQDNEGDHEGAPAMMEGASQGGCLGITGGINGPCEFGMGVCSAVTQIEECGREL